MAMIIGPAILLSVIGLASFIRAATKKAYERGYKDGMRDTFTATNRSDL